MNDPLAVGAGGGATTIFDESRRLPLARRCTSWDAEGGGAMTEGAGKFSFGFRLVARSGADTGGGTTAGVICTGEWDNSRLMALGAGAVTLDASAGAGRA